MIENLTEPLRTEVSSFVNEHSWKPKVNGNGNGNGTHKNGHRKEEVFNFDERKVYPEYLIRAIDFFGGILGLLIFSPIFIITYLIILITSGAPVFFRQKRLGKNGKVFKIIKFRTMRKDAEDILREHDELYNEYVNNDFKLSPDKDPRIIPFGYFLRKTSIDELPQFLNVIKGDMSLVGPRPIVPKEIERYNGYEEEFLSVKPGITGLWQVTGRSEIGYPDRLYLDLVYVQKKTPALDFKILFRTPFIVLKKVGAH